MRYIHSDVDTLERIEIIRDLRLGVFDVLVGINLLREGLDIPECALVAILDADKEGYLRSQTSLIQTIGRAARNVDGRVILYADRMTGSLDYAIKETQRRREKQEAYNKENGITRNRCASKSPTSWIRCSSATMSRSVPATPRPIHLVGKDLKSHVAELEARMRAAAADLEFEEAARIRDEIRRLEALDLGVDGDGAAPVSTLIVGARVGARGHSSSLESGPRGRGRGKRRARRGP